MNARQLNLQLRSLAFCAAALAAGTARGQAAPPPAPCTGPEFRQMDFWLGEWTLRWDATPGIPAGSGSNTITRAFGGCVVQEDFAGGPSTGALVGRSLSAYHTPVQRWRQTWVDNQGGYFALVGGPEGQRFVLTAAGPAGDKPALRMVFEAITDKSLTWRWQASADSGATWVDRWVIHYTRADPSAAPALPR